MLLASIIFMSCFGKKIPIEEETPSNQNINIVVLNEKQIQLANIQLGKIEKRQMSATIKVNGKLEVPPQQNITISIPYGGFLKNTTLLEGMLVRKGQILAELSHPDYIQFQQDYIILKAQMEFEKANYYRQKELNNNNVSTLKEYQQAQADYATAKAKVAALEQKLKMLHLDPKKIADGKIFASIKIRSPITGYVTLINSNVGAFVPAGSELFRIVDTRHLHVELTAFEKDLPSLKIGQSIRLVLGNEQKNRQAHVYLIGKEISPERAVRIHGHLDKEDANLIPGTYLKAWIDTDIAKVNSLPTQAVVQYEGATYIFIKQKQLTNNGESIFQKVKVIQGISADDYVEVILPENFDKNTEVVTYGAFDLLSKMNLSEEE